jgi:DNA-directed RNA polymerase specialized sigma24 family protein
LLITIAARRLIDQYRRNTRRVGNTVHRRSFDDPEVIAALAKMAGVNTPSQLCMARENQELYRQRWEDMVNKQPPLHRRIVYLRLGGQHYTEIAKSQNVTERHARRIFDRLFQKLAHSDHAA